MFGGFEIFSSKPRGVFSSNGWWGPSESHTVVVVKVTNSKPLLWLVVVATEDTSGCFCLLKDHVGY